MVDNELRAKFGQVWHSLLLDIKSHFGPTSKHADISGSIAWLLKCMENTVPHGKCARGLAVVYAYQHFVKKDEQNNNECTELTPEKERVAMILGWCIEIFQASCLVADDIMDGSETRRGRACWYKVDGVGLLAINDAFMLENIVYFLLRKYFAHLPCFMELVMLFHDVTLKTTFGQSLDTRASVTESVHSFTPDLYSTICKYKTSYYSFYLPFRLAMSLAGVKTTAAGVEACESVLLQLGHLFQVQDDMLDCFGDPVITGKVGTDIQDGKCTWLVVKALQKMNDAQKLILDHNYRSEDAGATESVKNLYLDLDIQAEFGKYENETFENIHNAIKCLPDEIPQKPFLYLLTSIYKRTK